MATCCAIQERETCAGVLTNEAGNVKKLINYTIEMLRECNIIVKVK